MSLKRSSLSLLFVLFVNVWVSGIFVHGEVVTEGGGGGRYCDFYQDEEEVVGGGGQAKVVKCAKESSHCFSLWRSPTLPPPLAINETEEARVGEDEVVDTPGSFISEDFTFIKQGCWEASGGFGCSPGHCVALVSSSELEESSTVNSSRTTTFFCCCSANNCNSNVSIRVVPDDFDDGLPSNRELSDLAALSQRSQLHSSLPHILSVVLGGTFLMLSVSLAILFIWRKRLRSASKGGGDDGGVRIGLEEVGDDLEAGHKLLDEGDPNLRVTDLILLGEELAKGKFATVWSGTCGGVSGIALKVFTGDHRDFFENEKYVYSRLSQLGHPHIVGYHGWQEFGSNLILVLARVEPGNLRDYLVSLEPGSPLDLPSTLKILKGLAEGLSFLHGNNREELVVAHRDLTSKNVLIDSNHHVTLADFGLSLITKGSKYCFAGVEKQAEFCSLAEAGTIRYLSPELLEGAVNLKDCENALKQADVYAMALVMWEICNLSRELSLAPTHSLPYEKEMGKDICMEKLSSFVVNRRERPCFSTWRKSPISRSIRDTLVETWDPEPEARLTALCIVERLHDLSILVTASTTPANSNLARDLSNANTTPLEPCPASPWIGRNPCLSRNLLDESSADPSNDYFVTTSEKHLRPAVTNADGVASILARRNYSISESFGSMSGAATTNTELSIGSTDNNGGQLNCQRPHQGQHLPQHPLNTSVPPTPIPFLQNIRR